MMKFRKVFNKILIFMLIGIFLSSNLAYASNMSSLRVPEQKRKQTRKTLRVPLDGGAHNRMNELYERHEGTVGSVNEKAKAIDVFIKINIKNKRATNLLAQTPQSGFPKVITTSLAELSPSANEENILQKLQNLFAQTKGSLWGIRIENTEDLPYHPDKEERERGTLVWGHSGTQSISYFYLPNDTIVEKAKRIYHEIVDRSTKLENMIWEKFNAANNDALNRAQLDSVLTEYEAFVTSIENTLRLNNGAIVFIDQDLQKEFANLTFKPTMFDVRHFTMAERKIDRRLFLKIIGGTLVFLKFPFLFTECSRTITKDDQNSVETLIAEFEEAYKKFIEETWDQGKKDAVNNKAEKLLNLKGTKKTYLGIKMADSILNQGQTLSEFSALANEPLYHLLCLSRLPIVTEERLSFLTRIYNLIKEGYKNIEWPDSKDDETARKIQFTQGIVKCTLTTIATARSISQPRDLSEPLANAAILFIGYNHLPALEGTVVTYLRDPNLSPFFKAPFIDYFVERTLWYMDIDKIPNDGFGNIMNALKDLFNDPSYPVRSYARATYNRHFISTESDLSEQIINQKHKDTSL